MVTCEEWDALLEVTMRIKHRIGLACVAFGGLLMPFLLMRPLFLLSPVKAGDQIVAKVNGRGITASQLATGIQGRDLKLKTDLYNLAKTELKKIVRDELLKQEAMRRGCGVAALLKQEVQDRVAAVSMEEAVAVQEYERSRNPTGGGKADTDRIMGIMVGARQRNRIEEFLRELSGRSQIEYLLDPPRSPEDLAIGPSRGQEGARIVVVIFSDFECRFCANANDAIRQLLADSGGQMRVVFRHFPLSSHRHAMSAAKAGVCADVQNSFWLFHDEIFRVASELSSTDFVALATRLGLDGKRFAECLTSPATLGSVARDREAGLRNGVTGTPTFFVNGRMVSGSSYEQLKDVMMEELNQRAPHR